jgi:hypothetical protein
MSWHTNTILVKADLSKDYAGVFKQLGLGDAEPGGMVSFDAAAATFNEGVAVATLEGWTALWGNMALFMIKKEGVAEIARKADVFEMLLEGTSGTAGFTWWTGGKQARRWMRQAGKVIANEGKPLPAEKAAFASNDDEQAVLQILTALTLPLKRLAEIKYRMYAVPDEVLFGG